MPCRVAQSEPTAKSNNDTEKTKMRVNKSCDQCRLRKVRCIVPAPTPNSPGSAATVCVHCANRNEHCNFSAFRRRARVKVPAELLALHQQKSKPSVGSSPNQHHDDTDTGELYIDRILQCGPQDAVLYDESASIVKAPDSRVPSSSMSFFSNHRVTSLAERLGTEPLRDLVENLNELMMHRVCHKQPAGPSLTDIRFEKPAVSPLATMPPQLASGFVDAFFEHVHPVYPFLDQMDFTWRLLDIDPIPGATSNAAFSALHHTIMALGSQYFSGGDFVAGSGQAWELFQVALGLLPEILAPPVSLVNLQALTAMAIFAMNPCCLQLDQTLISEAARMAQMLRYHKSGIVEIAHLRTFWVIYYLEKISSFSECTSSLLADQDIGVMIPLAPESMFGPYNFFVSAIRLGRISSIAYSSLFSISASLKPRAACLSAIANVRRMLEDWRQSIPALFRPGEATDIGADAGHSTKLALLWTQYSYYNIVFALERRALQVVADDNEASRANQESKANLVMAARSVIELIRFIDVEPSVPIFLSGIMPLSALFILFDFVIHNPSHSSTQENLALLDAASRYFSLIDVASKGILPGNIISEFAGIARRYSLRFAAGPAVLNGGDLSSGASVASAESNHSAPTNSMVTGLEGFHLANGSSMTGMTPLSFTTGTSDIQSFGMVDWQGLNYPTPDTSGYNGPSGVQTGELKTMFGWIFPDWGEIELK
ncbi:fungal-specific transcription factor [Podospora australis]|uniref:Fungal-specific transcription factor n=1 Tax=Podospora australis TaxID=1536484 RepID=A0AAN6WIS2_9PEZI|nr:fungal-specific transcription factor [Podospora australis]